MGTKKANKSESMANVAEVVNNEVSAPVEAVDANAQAVSDQHDEFISMEEAIGALDAMAPIETPEPKKAKAEKKEKKEKKEVTAKAEKKDNTPTLDVQRQQFIADEDAFMEQARKTPYSKVCILKGNFTMKKDYVSRYLPQGAKSECTKKHHFDITFADGAVFHLHPKGIDAVSDMSAVGNDTKEAVKEFSKHFFTEDYVNSIFG